MKSLKTLSVLALSMIMALVMAVSAHAAIVVEEVELDGTELSEVSSNRVLALEKGDEVTVKVTLHSDQDVDNMQVEAAIRGYDHDDLIQDITGTFKMKQNVTYVKRLTLPVRERMDQDQYRLRVRVEDRDGQTMQMDYTLEIESERHNVVIRDVILNPENEVQAGRALLASVRVENRGQKDEKDVKVQVSIPSLGVSATSFIDEVEREDDDDDRKTSEEMFLRIPSTVESGVYMLTATVTYDEGDEVVTQQVPVTVVGAPTVEAEAESAAARTVITLASDVEAAQAGGSETAFPITLTNAGSESKVYTVSVDGANWGEFRVSPSNVVVVGAGESKAVNVFASPSENAQAGRQTFLLTVSSEGKVLKQIPLQVEVSAAAQAEKSTWRKLVEVGVIVALILVVVIGLIFAFTRRKDDEEDSEDEQSYY